MTARLKKRRTGFQTRHLTVRRGPSAVHYLSKPVTFWVAVMSLFAFVSGNMVGQHGFYVFWHSVWGQVDDSLIVYNGTVSPIALIPDPVKWAKYGGDQRYHTYQQAPKDVLIPLPSYIPVDQIPAHDVVRRRLISVDYLGTYATGGGKGSHAGVDIPAPQGTPVSNVMNGIVVDARNEPNGFGNYVLIRHPNVPDPHNPSKTATLYTLYAHLDSYAVDKGMLINKGDVIGTVGKTGDASGFHLHFQMNYQSVDKLWAFTWSDLRNAGMTFTEGVDKGLNRDQLMTYTVNPMQYVQANYAPVQQVIAQKTASSRMTVAQRAALRRQSRVATVASRVVSTNVVAIAEPAPTPAPAISSSAATVMTSSSSATPTVPAVPPVTSVGTVKIAEVSVEVPYDFGQQRKWQNLRIVLRDEHGNAIKNPILDRPLNLRTAFGKAEFNPAVLTAAHFRAKGYAEVQILPLGQQTVVVELVGADMPVTSVLSRPIRYAGR